VIHVYGIVDELPELPQVAGVDDAPLERQRLGDVELVISRSETPPAGEVSREAVLRHAEVVEELMRRSNALLPAQLGRMFANEDELSTAVRTRADDFARALERVRGCVEFGLRVHEPTTDRGEAQVPRSGAEYMQERLAEVRRRDQLLAELHEPLARLSRATVVTPGAADGLRAAYLVPKANVAAFSEAVQRLEHARPELTIVSTGPWPPYSFADPPQEAV
jgi:hypothetical protein